jgi:hypothetical protein
MNKRAIPVVALLASAYAIIGLLPGLPIVGVSGSEIDLVRSLEPAYGILLGPAFGTIAAFLGALVGKLISGDSIGLLFTPLALISTFIVAILYRRTIFGIAGWAISVGILLSLTLGWYLHPAGISVPYYTIPHLIAIIILIIFRSNLSNMLRSDSKRQLALGVLLSSFPATMAGNMLGNLIFMAVFNPPPLFFAALLPIMVAERLLISFLSVALSVPLILAVRNLYPHIIE